jgi:hypothetical protein
MGPDNRFRVVGNARAGCGHHIEIVRSIAYCDDVFWLDSQFVTNPV